jgi:hypothetical protein
MKKNERKRKELEEGEGACKVLSRYNGKGRL